MTGYRAPVRIRLPRRRRYCRAARRRPRSRRLAARARTTATGASRSSSSRRSTTRTPEVHIAGTVDVDVPLHRAGGAPSTAPLVPRAVVRILAPRVRSSSRVWSSLTSARPSAPGRVVLIVGTVSRTCRDTEEESHAVALSLGLLNVTTCRLVQTCPVSSLIVQGVILIVQGVILIVQGNEKTWTPRLTRSAMTTRSGPRTRARRTSHRSSSSSRRS